MPHDANGKEIKVGDRVTMEFEIERISSDDGDCNVGLKAIDTVDGTLYRPGVTCSSKLTKLLSLAAWLVAFFLPAPADAGGYCFRSSCYRPAVVFKQPVYQLQEHQYYQILGQLRQPVYAPQQVQQACHPAQPAEPTARQYLELRNQDMAWIQSFASGQPPTLNPPPGYPPPTNGGTQPPPNGGQPPPAEPPPAEPPNELMQLRNGVRQIVNAKCVSCHDAKGGVMGKPIELSLDPSVIVDLTRDDVMTQLACVIMAEVIGGTMPKLVDGEPAPLGDQERTLVVRWEKAERLAAAQQLRTQPQQQQSAPQQQPPPAPPAPSAGAGGR